MWVVWLLRSTRTWNRKLLKILYCAVAWSSKEFNHDSIMPNPWKLFRSAEQCYLMLLNNTPIPLNQKKNILRGVWLFRIFSVCFHLKWISSKIWEHLIQGVGIIYLGFFIEQQKVHIFDSPSMKIKLTIIHLVLFYRNKTLQEDMTSGVVSIPWVIILRKILSFISSDFQLRVHISD